MRKVVAYQLLSVDGVAESPDEFIEDWDDVLDAHLASVISAQDAVILGRRSYDEWSTYWPDSDVEPFATFINGVTKYVATSTSLDPTWANTTVAGGDLAELVRELKAQPGADIGVHASIAVTRSLLAAGLLDELRMVVAPVIAGSGRKLFDGLPAIRLGLVESMSTPNGSLLVHYRVQPPGETRPRSKA